MTRNAIYSLILMKVFVNYVRIMMMLILKS